MNLQATKPAVLIYSDEEAAAERWANYRPSSWAAFVAHTKAEALAQLRRADGAIKIIVVGPYDSVQERDQFPPTELLALIEQLGLSLAVLIVAHGSKTIAAGDQHYCASDQVRPCLMQLCRNYDRAQPQVS